ncbi:hypothetical protein HMPREF1576_01372 [Gardnerella pickettii JCP7719]|uniref:Uncharacterized protein n=1 Tax=Gardnerella pickettii JCP7719 TaxID=1261061 RepID=S4GKE4_9BIFI|nr:hypothetical protein HMPREF1576_01372 [Gardnerella pickettii JCP7719]
MSHNLEHLQFLLLLFFTFILLAFILFLLLYSSYFYIFSYSLIENKS